MIELGQQAPDFSAETSQGKKFHLAAARGKPVVVYFFPKAFTAGCRVETSRFRDAYPELTAQGAEVVGISTDNHETQCSFAESLNVTFPMIGDTGGTIAELFGVRWPLIGIPKRVTFLIDGAGVVRGVFHHEFQISKHLDQVLIALQKLPQAAPQQAG